MPEIIEIAAHNLINTQHFPQGLYRLGQSERFVVADGHIDITRCGNLYNAGKSALTYKYKIVGPGFAASVRAVWEDEDQATADVTVLSVLPSTETAKQRMLAWMLGDHTDGSAQQTI
jgi:hypothetical protein